MDEGQATDTDVIVGIDLGTTNSLIGVFDADGPRLFKNDLGHVSTASAISLMDDKTIAVGDIARHRLISHPTVSAARFKRYMGTQKTFRLGKKQYSAQDLSALVLRSLKRNAEDALSHSVSRAVISVPAYFNDIQRKATVAAGRMAGFEVERLVNEPTAAALAYGIDMDGDETILVLDLGGGTFDVSILEIFDGVMEVRSSAGDINLGGEDFTDFIYKEFCDQLGPSGSKLTEKNMAALRALAEKAKIAMNDVESFSGSLLVNGKSYDLVLDQSRFEALSKPLLDRLRQPIQKALNDASLRARDMNRIILVGGATRMNVVRQAVTRLMKSFPEHGLDPDQVIALGACIQGGLVSRHSALEDRIMTDVSPFTLGIETSRMEAGGSGTHGLFAPILERNTVIPASRVQNFNKIHRDQKVVDLRIYQGEAAYVSENVHIGSMTIFVGDQPHDGPGFDVRFTYDSSGLLEVIVTVVATGREQRIVIEGNSVHMSDKDIEKRLKELSSLKIHPKNDAENQWIIAQLKSEYENALGDKRHYIQAMLNDFATVLDKQNPRQIENAREQVREALQLMSGNDLE